MTSLKGAGGSIAKYLYGKKHDRGLTGYYTSQVEGRWFGDGVGLLGGDEENKIVAPEAGGLVDEEVFTRLMNGARPSRLMLGRKFAEARVKTRRVRDADGAWVRDESGGFVREPVLGKDGKPVMTHAGTRAYDVTFSVTKDVSLLWALTDNDAVRDTIETQVQAAVNDVLQTINDRAVARISRGTREDRVRDWVRADGIIAATFAEPTSRAGDPNLHVHAVVSNRVHVTDPVTGESSWMALDASEFFGHPLLLSALFHKQLENRLTEHLGVQWGTRVQKLASPLAGDIPAGLLELFSKRTGQVNVELDRRLTRFRAEMGREPTARETAELEREAAERSRKGQDKSHGDRPDWKQGLHDGWRTEALAAGFDPERVIASIGIETDPARLTAMRVTPDSGLLADVAAAAIGEVADGRATWQRNHLVTALLQHLPSGLTWNQPDGMLEWAETTATRIIDEQMVGLDIDTNGDPVTPTKGHWAATYTTSEILAQETAITSWAHRAFDAGGEPAAVLRLPTTDTRLAPAQSELAARAAGTERLVIGVGVGGSGKTTVMATTKTTLDHQQREVIGLTPTAKAGAELAEATGMTTTTLHRFIGYHTNNHPRTRPEFDLAPGATIIVDEAGMVSTPLLHQLTTLAQTNDWRVVMIGDPLQLSAVGRSGMFAHLVDHPPTSERPLVTELTDIYRFRAGWEAQASRQLRTGNPQAIDTYLQHDRIRSTGNPVDDAVTEWATHTTNGETVRLIAPTNKLVAELNRAAQQHRHNHSQLGDPVAETSHGTFHIGDTVITRHNSVDHPTSNGGHILNGTEWTITHHNPGTGDITIADTNGATATIDPEYTQHHLRLGYASTIHGVQGATLDHAITVIKHDDPIDRRALYVAMSRGRTTNRIYTHTANLAHHYKRIIARPSPTEAAITHQTTPPPPVVRAEQQQLFQQLPIAHPTPTNTIDTTETAPAPTTPVKPATKPDTEPQVEAEVELPATPPTPAPAPAAPAPERAAAPVRVPLTREQVIELRKQHSIAKGHYIAPHTRARNQLRALRTERSEIDKTNTRHEQLPGLINQDRATLATTPFTRRTERRELKDRITHLENEHADLTAQTPVRAQRRQDLTTQINATLTEMDRLQALMDRHNAAWVKLGKDHGLDAHNNPAKPIKRPPLSR